MSVVLEPVLRTQLLDRREKLETALTSFGQQTELNRLLEEVDAALARMNNGSYGLCEVCHDPIEPERIIADPLTKLCLGDITPTQQRALEKDLELAAMIQQELLPKKDCQFKGWEICYHYEALSLVSGDYCDLVSAKDESLYFILGDVSGKGVAASMLMAHLNAMFRALISVGLPLNQLVERASRVFCESTLPSHYATLVCGRANRSGKVEICNAGHLSPLLLQGNKITSLTATGLPIGLFSDEKFSVREVQLSPGDTLLLYTDGLSELQDSLGIEYGADKLARLLMEYHMLPPQELIDTCLKDLLAFQSTEPRTDDLTILAIRRADN